MSYKDVDQAIKLDLPAMQKIVLIAIASHRNSITGHCFPSIATIAKTAGMSERSVIRHIETLKSDKSGKILEVISNFSNGLKGSNTYRFNFSKQIHLSETKGTDSTNEGCDNLSHRSDNLSHRSDNLSQINDRLSLRVVTGCHINKEVNQESNQEKEYIPKNPKKQGVDKNRHVKKTTLPEAFDISESVTVWYLKNGYSEDINQHFENFVGKCLANGYKYVDFDEALKCAIREDWAKLRTQKSPVTGANGQGLNKNNSYKTGADNESNKRNNQYPIGKKPSLADRAEQDCRIAAEIVASRERARNDINRAGYKPDMVNDGEYIPAQMGCVYGEVY